MKKNDYVFLALAFMAIVIGAAWLVFSFRYGMGR